MKLKKFSFIAVSSALVTSLFALTSCSDKKSIDIKSYSNEISEETFLTETSSFKEDMDVTPGYEYESYSYLLSESKNNSIILYRESFGESYEKYDGTNNIFYKKASSSLKEDEGKDYSSSNGKEEYQIQSDEKDDYKIDLLTKRYVTTYSPKTYAMYNYSFYNEFENTLYYSGFDHDFTKTKYFKDDNTFTLELTFDQELINKYNNEQTDEVKTNYEMEGKFVIQFYNKDDVYYIAYEYEMNGKQTRTKGDKSTTSEGSMEGNGYKKLVKAAQTIEKLDLSKYDLGTGIDLYYL